MEKSNWRPFVYGGISSIVAEFGKYKKMFFLRNFNFYITKKSNQMGIQEMLKVVYLR